VIRWYGKYNLDPTWNYPNLLDVIFDHRPNDISHGHFTDYVSKNIKGILK